MMYVLLIIGFVLLIKGADFFVEGSASVAKSLHIPSIIIGLTIVAMGTSLPEAAVSITAALNGRNGLAVSNVLGSNMFNLLIVLGASCIAHPVIAKGAVVKRELPFSMGAVVLLILAATRFKFTDLMSGQGTYPITRWMGLVLLAGFVLFLYMQLRDAKKARSEYEGEDYEVLPMWKSLLFIVGGIAAIGVGGELVVRSATQIATAFGMSESFIGLTIVAMGTSLPELVTSFVAARKGENELALGNVVGSNIFNILLILGASTAIHPITVDTNAIYDMAILVVMSFMVYFFAKNENKMGKKEGILFLIMYFVYFGYIYAR